MAKRNFLIYGSYGYTGNLIAELACKEGMKPVLGGRDMKKLAAQADRLGLEYRMFDVADADETKAALENVIAVINCAGPFINTWKNMADACLATHTHYVDITGEVHVFEKLMEMNKPALDADVMLLPGAGFDVVPSDCLAEYLKGRLPDAVRLTLCINALWSSAMGLKVSRGTAKTMLAGMTEGAMVREQGELKKLPAGLQTLNFDFGDHQPLTAVTVAWGDLVTAWWSTNIPNIETYMVVSPRMIRLTRMLDLVKSVLNWGPFRRLAELWISKMPAGPTADERNQSAARIYGEVVNASGNKAAALIYTPDGYAFTALSAIAIIKKILAGDAHAGFQTPSIAYGEDFVLEIPGVERKDVE